MKNIHYYKWTAFSLCIAGLIAAWDIKYAQKNFEIDKWLVIFMMILIHLSYIILPYLEEEKKLKRKKIKDNFTFVKVMRATFFIAALLPASLQISGQFLTKMESDIRTKPEAPILPILDSQIDESIKRENYWLWVAEQNKDQIKINEVSKRLEKLNDQKSRYIESLSKYNEELTTYPEKLKQYNEYKAKNRITWIFDFMNLFFPFAAIVSLQLMNMKTSQLAADIKNNQTETIKIKKIVDTTEKEPKQLTTDEIESFTTEPEPAEPVKQESLQNWQEPQSYFQDKQKNKPHSDMGTSGNV